MNNWAKLFTDFLFDAYIVGLHHGGSNGYMDGSMDGSMDGQTEWEH